MTSRDSFHQSLELIRAEVDVLGSLAEAAARGAATALLTQDRLTAFGVIAGDDQLDQRFVHLEQRTYGLIAQQAPVAVDLRFLVSALRVMADWERTGDLAVAIAKLSVDDWDRESTAIRLLGRMADIALDLVAGARRAWREGDAHLGAALAGRDDQLDTCYRQLCAHLIQQHGPDASVLVFHALLAGRHFERIADHAVAVGERVVYMKTGDPSSLAAEIS